MTETLKNLMSFPPLASKHGADVDNLLLLVHYLMGFLFIVWICYFAYVLFRFRASRNAKADPVGYKGHATTYMEIGVAVVEGLLLIFFALPFWANAAEGFPAEKDATVVRVTAQQFAWNSRYAGKDGVFGKQDLKFLTTDNKFGVDPDDPAAKDDVVPPLNEMALPVNKPAILKITSMDVIHNFAVHPLRIMQDAIPGISIATHFIPTKEGKYQITCAQLCGNSHYFMKGYLFVKSQTDYDAWFAEKSKSGAGAASFE
jgi:cytochrome c oxidase subunit 2